MERYSTYKDSGVSWIGEIPEHWALRRVKYIFSELKEKSENGLETPLSLSKDGGIIPFNEKKNRTMESASYVGGKIVHKGEIVFNRFKARLFAVSAYDGIVSSDYAVYECNKTASPEYMVKLFGIDIYRDAFNRKASGIGDGFSRLYTDDLFAMYSIFPPLAEQEKIVSYLGDKTSKIDAYVADKEKEIELLQELKQKTIADAVTKGLNPDAKMKDSGISWIGEIPEHWEVKKIGSLFVERREKVSDKEFPALSVSKQGVTPQLDTAVKTDNGDNRKKVCKNDFVVNSRSDRKGSCGVSPYTGSVSLINIVLSPRENIEVQYFHHLFRSNNYIEEYYRIGRGIVADLWTTRYSEMRNIFVPLPPLDEQQAIVAYIEEKCEKIDKLASELQSEIDYLKEYKQRLIADCVTGQVNVSGV